MENKTVERKVHKIVVDRKMCISAGTCIVVAPAAFEFDDEAIAVVKADALSVDDGTLFVSAQSCPTQAIFLFDKEGKQIFPLLQKE